MVVKLEQAATAARVGESPDAGFVTVVVSVQSQSAKSIVDALHPLLSKPVGTAAVLGDSQLIVVSDFSARVEELKQVIKRLDVPEPTIVREVTLRNIAASQLIPIATQLAAKKEAAGARKLAGDLVATSDGSTVLIVAPSEADAVWVELIQRRDRREEAPAV